LAGNCPSVRSENSVKQVAQNYRSGELAVLDVPAPSCRPGGVLVRSLFSLISTGTEMTKVNEAKLSLLGKARARPDQVRKVLDSVAQQGLRTTYSKAMNRLDSFTPLGYSLAGIVLEVGHNAERYQVGQLVACAGNEYALHSEVNWVPTNLCVPVPDSVSPQLAAFATVGAIALHGVRRSEPQLGDAACVIGLGLVGQIVVRLLDAAGVRVVGLDTSAERCRLAEAGGAVACDRPHPAGLDHIERALSELTGGFGADHVLLAAGGSSNAPVEAAARLARDRGRVVDIGKLSLDLPWNAYYEKELDVRFSRSYGPGRYDESYEVGGVDYPVGYVRWTERRNLAAFLDLVARGLPIGSLLSEVFPITDAETVYKRLGEGKLSGIGFLFSYPESEAAVPEPKMAAVGHRSAAKHARAGGGSDRLKVGFLGAGNYASSMLLPHLSGRKDVTLAKVATNTSLSAANAKRRFGFASASTDVDSVLSDEAVDAVFIVTRHHSHADLVCRALAAGKATFVEKPLALTDSQLDQVIETVRDTGNDRLMVGFNRRFAPLLTDLRDRFGPPPPGAVLRYLVNAGPLEAKSWYRNESEEGSRFVGEGCHFIDVASWWLDAQPIEVSATGALDNKDLHVVVRYDTGSVASIDYLTQGHPRFPKETIEVSAGGRSARLDNFTRATIWSGRRSTSRRARGRIDKGQSAQIEAFVQAVQTGGPMPIPWSSLIATTGATLAVERSIAAGSAQKV
jgi:predicted dehydrogenase/threonine dehydrogenase-like Zn-dependent dehydrogenase